jgi:hypothetical protein
MLFIDNKYTRWYYSIINNAKIRINKPNEYLENHHIIPECFYVNRKRSGPKGWLVGDPDDPSNKVELTPEEHRVCHLLLVNMTEGEARIKMSLAAYMVHTMASTNQERITNKAYGSLKRQHSEAMSKIHKGVPKSAISNKRRSESLKGRGAGITVVKDEMGAIFRVPVNDSRLTSGELVGVTKGKVTVKDKNGSTMSVDKHDPRILTGELVGVTKGFMVVKDRKGNITQVSVTDPRVLSGELVHISDGTIPPWVGKKKKCQYCLEDFDTGNYYKSHGEKCPVKNGLLTNRQKIQNRKKKEKSISVNGRIFETLTAASKILEINICTLSCRARNPNFPSIFYI